MESSDSRQRIPVEVALQILAETRTDRDVMITNQGSSRLWPRISQHAGDFNYNPSNMGGAIPLALGLALACPQREIVVVSGDGSLLMNLGCLVTVIDSRATNLSIVLLDNGLYEVTGGQATPAARSATDFAAIAAAVGFPTVADYRDADLWRAKARSVLRSPGPRFVSLRVTPLHENCLGDATQPIAEQIQRLREFLVG